MSIDFEEALARVRALYANPMQAAEAARAAGQKLIGVVGPTVPVELVIAAGCFPVMLTGRGSPTPTGDRFMEHLFEPELREVFDNLLAGGYGRLDAVIIPRSSDTYNKLYLYLREADRLGHGAHLPRLEFYDILHTQTALSYKYGLERTRELAEVLEEIGGKPVDHASVSQAVAEMNRLRAALRTFVAQRDAGTAAVSPADALKLLSLRRFDLPENIVSLVEAITEQGIVVDTTPRILLSGFPLNHCALHEAVSANGGLVVAENDWWGSRAAEADVDVGEDAIAAVFSAIFYDGYSIRTEPRLARDKWLQARLKRNALDGVIFYIPPFDDVSGWDYPGHRDVAEAAGLVTMRFDEDVAAPEQQGPLTETLQAFMAKIKEARGGR